MNDQDRDLVRYACVVFGWSELKGTLAYDLHEKELVRFGSFPVKNPRLSPSPVYFNFRASHHPTSPGNLATEDARRVGSAIFDTVWSSNLHYDVVAGIPYAGEALVDGFLSHLSAPKWRSATFQKLGEGESRRVTGFQLSRPYGGGGKGRSILLIDDVISAADSKFEAIKAVKEADFRIAGIAVLIDREQGGAERLEKRGYRLISVFRLSELLAFYVLTLRIFRKNFEDIMGYMERSRKIIAAH